MRLFIFIDIYLLLFTFRNSFEILYELFEATTTDLNITIARTAAAAFLQYKSLKGKREFLIPDFLIGAHAQYYTNSILTSNPRDFQKYIPKLNVITPIQFIKMSRIKT